MRSKFKTDFWDRQWSFWTTLLFVLLAISVVFAVIFVFGFEYSPSNPTDFVSSISDFLAVIIGLPIAFAGSIVAVILAQRSVQISKRQELSDNKVLIDDYVSDIHQRYIGLSDSMRNYFTATTDIANYFLDKLRTDRAHDFNKDTFFQTKLDSLYASQRVFIDSTCRLGEHYVTREIFSCFETIQTLDVESLGDAEFDSFFYQLNTNGIREAADFVSTKMCRSNTSDKLLQFFKISDNQENIFNLHCYSNTQILTPVSILLLAGLFIAESVAEPSFILSNLEVSDPDFYNSWINDHHNSDDLQEFGPDETIVRPYSYYFNFGAAFLIDILRQSPYKKPVKKFIENELNDRLFFDETIEFYINQIVSKTPFQFYFNPQYIIAAEYIADDLSYFLVDSSVDLYSDDSISSVSANFVGEWLADHSILEGYNSEFRESHRFC